MSTTEAPTKDEVAAARAAKAKTDAEAKAKAKAEKDEAAAKAKAEREAKAAEAKAARERAAAEKKEAAAKERADKAAAREAERVRRAEERAAMPKKVRLTNSQRRHLSHLASAGSKGVSPTSVQSKQPYIYFVEQGLATSADGDKFVINEAGKARAADVDPVKYALPVKPEKPATADAAPSAS